MASDIKPRQPLYLDYNATTPLDPRVFEVMKEWYLGPPANAGSRTHLYGQRAKDAVEKARQQVAMVINAKPEEIIFTSGATESNNIAILGLAAHGEETGKKHIVSTAIEHKAVLEPLHHLAQKGFEVELVPVSKGGFIDPEDILRRCRKDTLLVSVMHANNETGVLQPVKEVGNLLEESTTYFHVDAAQTYAKELDLQDVRYDLLSFTSHKICGPQGIGALGVNRNRSKRMPISALSFGGGQERALRPGTIPVALTVGFGEAARLAFSEIEFRSNTLPIVKEAFLEQLSGLEFFINGDCERTQFHVVNLRFPGVDSEALMMLLKMDLAISNGSACTTDRYQPSHVLTAMGLTDDDANESVRISWGTYIDHQEAFAVLRDAVKSIRVIL